MFTGIKLIILISGSCPSKSTFSLEHICSEFLTIVYKRRNEKCSLLNVTINSRSLFSSSQGDAGEDGPKGDAGEKV
jgi:hypothetical protein